MTTLLSRKVKLGMLFTKASLKLFVKLGFKSKKKDIIDLEKTENEMYLNK